MLLRIKDQCKNFAKSFIATGTLRQYNYYSAERELEAPASTASGSGGSRSSSKVASRPRGSGRGLYRAGASRIARSKSRRGKEGK